MENQLEVGTYVANTVVRYIRQGEKIKAIKALRDLGYDFNSIQERHVISLRDAKYFVEGIMSVIAEDAVEKEVTQYRKLREAGYSIEETMKIIKALA